MESAWSDEGTVIDLNMLKSLESSTKRHPRYRISGRLRGKSPVHIESKIRQILVEGALRHIHPSWQVR